VERIEAFSGHGDYNEMKQFLLCQDPKQIRQVFLVHGEYDSQLFYKGQLEKAGFSNICIPEAMSEVEL